MGLKAGVLGLLVALLCGMPARAGEVVYRNKAVTCVATTPEVTRMWVEGVSFGLGYNHAWGKAKVNVLLRNNKVVQYTVGGKADLIVKQLLENRANRSFSYAGVACTVQHRSIVAVQNCRGGASGRACDVGLHFNGREHAYAVSLTVQPAR